MKFRHMFAVRAPLDRVTDFHARSDSMGLITPPPITVWVHQAPERLRPGAQMDFTLWLGPLPVRWLAVIEALPGHGFLDRQILGPFKRWEHRHIFLPMEGPAGEPGTYILDEVEAELHDNPLWRLIGLGMWLGMPLLFGFRGWKTSQILEGLPAPVSDAAG